MRKSSLAALFLLIGILYGCSIKQPYQDKTIAVEKRTDNLIAQLSIDEKALLMRNSSDAIPRLGIRKYDWWNEALHGVARNGIATVFPQAIGMAASFDEKLLKEVFTSISDEARVKHRIARQNNTMKRYTGLTMWTPNINIFRDPRWGRGQETYGEDPYLTGVLGVAVINGLQGEPINGIDKLHACAKHFAVHSGPEWNRHSFNAENISPRDLWETYLPAFKMAVEQGKVKEIMCAYNRFEGEPCCGSNRLLVDILRNKWNYDGIVLSDCGAINNFFEKGKHMTEPDVGHAISKAILSGTDLECGSTYKAIAEAVKQGLIEEEKLDISLKRVIKARYELGEMDGASPWDSLPDTLINCQKHQELALKMAQESMVLLQNNGILPLASGTKIALLGPNGDDAQMQWGNYHGTPNQTITMRSALQQLYVDNTIIYHKACDVTGNTETLFSQCESNIGSGLMATFWNNETMEGTPANTILYTKAIKVSKRDTIAQNVNLSQISAKIEGIFIPEVSGNVEFIFTTNSNITLTVDGRPLLLKHIPKSLQVANLEVKAGNTYAIDIACVKSKKGELRFDIQRRIEPDFKQIKKVVSTVDVVIFAGGISATLEREDANVYAPGFVGGDRTDIELPKSQRDIIAFLKKIGKKVVLVNFSGSTIGLAPESRNCDAILQAWYPGEAGGKAIADVLFGNYNPAGRLPITFYKNIDQLPDFENYDLKGRTYRYMEKKPLYPFGHGLSYSTFKYGTPTLDKDTISVNETIYLSIPVTNTSKIDGDEVVQVYLKKRDDNGGPTKTLRAFTRVSIPAGKTIDLFYELNSENLSWWDNTTQAMTQHAGDFILKIGGSSEEKSLTSISFTIK